MKIQRPYTIDFFDVDHRFCITYKAIARLFQGLATHHSHKVGSGYTVLTEKGFVWFLHRLKIEIVAWPKLFDEVILFTWSRGFKGFKGFREYTIETKTGEILVKGSAVWLFYDLKRKRISKVPDQISGCYRFEQQKNFNTELDDWKPVNFSAPESEMDIPLRYSDFDINGHVNNTEYVGFLESYFHLNGTGGDDQISSLKIRFEKEIDRTKGQVCVGSKREKNQYHCRIYAASARFAQAHMISKTP